MTYVPPIPSYAVAAALRWRPPPVPDPLPFPLPAGFTYDWPIPVGFSPGPHQKLSVRHHLMHTRSWDLSEQRTGKTWSALWAADILMRLAEASGARWRALVVCPLSTVRDVWEAGVFDLFMGRRSAACLIGSRGQRHKALESGADFLIVNPDGVAIVEEALKGAPGLEIAILDESTAFKTARSQRSQAVRRVVRDFRYQWQLTGTPLSEDIEDAHGLLHAMHGSAPTMSRIRETFKTRVGPFRWKPRPGAQEAAVKLLRPALRWRQDEVFANVDIPPQWRIAELGPEQKKALKELQTKASTLIGQGRIDAANSAVVQSKFLQVSGGVVYDAAHASHRIDARSRICVLRELVREAPSKVLVFSPLTNVNEFLAEELADLGFLHLQDGPTRSAQLARFKTDDAIRGLIAHPGPIARGHDLTVAATVIWYLPPPRTEDFLQANERTNGPRQTRSRSIFLLYGSALEKAVYQNKLEKAEWQKTFLELAKTHSLASL